jgi:ribose 5-phosphate isomerase B
MSQKIYVGCDHAGIALKKPLLEGLRKALPHLQFEDLGCHSEESVDYPNYAEQVGRKVAETKGRGILVCGSGLGMCIAANKVNGVRAASAWDATSARLSRQHNDANIVCLGARLTGPEVALEAVKVWLTTEFEGGRHQRRVDLISKLEG